MEIVTLKDKNYPELLQKIKNPPPKLYVEGSLLQEEKYPLAVVGTRAVSNYGAEITKQLVKELAGAGMTIISGLALGIDGLAHQAALRAGGKTIAVLGTGLDVIYPASHKGLAKKILASGGALVSEFPAKTPSFKGNFPLRNRIISGLALGVLIIEAPEKSGALITAEYAKSQGRKVFAVPASVFSQNSAGCNLLLKKGAQAVTQAQDILEFFGIKPGASVKKEIKPASPEEELLFKYLNQEPIHIDKLIEFSKLPTHKVSETLILMELAGKVKNLGNGYYLCRGETST